MFFPLPLLGFLSFVLIAGSAHEAEALVPNLLTPPHVVGSNSPQVPFSTLVVFVLSYLSALLALGSQKKY
jgi:hypothetical protein